MTEREFRAWLGGLVEGFAGRALETSYLESLVHRIMVNAPGKDVRHVQSGPEQNDDEDKDAFLRNYGGPAGEDVEIGEDGEVTAPTVADLKNLRNPDGSLKKFVPVIPRPTQADLEAAMQAPVGAKRARKRGYATPVGDPMAASTDASPGVVMMTSSPVR